MRNKQKYCFAPNNVYIVDKHAVNCPKYFKMAKVSTLVYYTAA